MTTRYVVRSVNDDFEERFWSIDHTSGGYPYWGSLYGAKMFESVEDASAVLTDPMMTKDCVMSDGTIYPPTMVHSGIGLCNSKQSGSMVISICEIIFSIRVQKEFKDTLFKQPKKAKSDQEIAKEAALNKLTPEERKLLGLTPAVPANFNGYHVLYWSHESRGREEQHFPTAEEVLAHGFDDDDGFPSVEDFAENLYNVYGDTVGKITDNDGTVLYDKMRDMEEEEGDASFYG